MKRLLIILLCGVIVLGLTGCGKEKGKEDGELPKKNDTSLKDEEVIWNEITVDGVDEDLFFKNLDEQLLEEIAKNLQSAIEEEAKEERENPEIVLTEGWVRIFKKEQYKKVVAMGKPAMKPLYWILYKSKNNGEYEYLCAKALQEISGISFEDSEKGTMGWSTAKEYLELFTKEIQKQSRK